MATWLKQSTAVSFMMGPFVDNLDGFTPKTALSITVANCRLSKNGAAFAAKAQATAPPQNENGWYQVSLDATDTNTVGSLVVAIYVAGALPVWREFQVMPAAIYDALVAGSANLAVNAAQIAAAAPDVTIRDAVFNGMVENGKTFVQFVRGMVAALFGKASGLDTTAANYRDNADTKNRITATVDEFGNRSNVTTDLS